MQNMRLAKQVTAASSDEQSCKASCDCGNYTSNSLLTESETAARMAVVGHPIVSYVIA